MHESVLAFLEHHLTREEVAGKRVLEVGSYDVNGTPRSIIDPLQPGSYTGLDFSDGPGVDVVGKAEELVDEFGIESFDVVISTELLEHVFPWREVISEMKRVTREGGILIVTTRAPGFPYHPYPVDLWRYTESDFQRIFSDMEIVTLVDDPMAPGVFLKARKPSGFKELDLSDIHVMPMEPPPSL
jgi:SAM-dependent methyltransferase